MLAVRLRAINGYFDSHTYSKGSAYFRSGRVSNCLFADDKIRGFVRGTSTYTTQVQLSPDSSKIVNAKCSCPLGGYCKHSVALVLAWDGQSAKKAEKLEKARAIIAMSNVAIFPSAANHAKRQINEPSNNPSALSSEISTALARFKRIFTEEFPSVPNIDVGPVRKRKAQKAMIAYILEEGSYTHKTRISAVKINILSNGECGAASPLRFTDIIDFSIGPRFGAGASAGPLLSYSKIANGSARGRSYIESDVLITEQLDTVQEECNDKLLPSLGFREVAQSMTENLSTTYFTSDDPGSWLKLQESFDSLKQDGWKIAPELLTKLTPFDVADEEVALEVSEENNWWLSLALNVEIGGKKCSLLPILLSAIRSLPNHTEYRINAIDKLSENGKFIAMLDDGRLLRLPFDRVRPILISLHELLLKHSSATVKGDKLKVAAVDAAAVVDSIETPSVWRNIENVENLARRLKSLASESSAQIAKSFTAELRSYQKDGFSWLQKIAEQKFGGILADDMGLGKTVQLLAFLTAAKEEGKLKKRPFLVVCPKSVLPNWLSECAKFAPDLKVLAISGQNRSENLLQMKFSDLVVTSYPLLARDVDSFKQVKWSGVALDESQMIKNSDTQMAVAACSLKADFRFCLTGTPIENNLGELWSQFRFLLPGFLGEKTEFKQIFQTPIEKENDLSKQALLSARIKPFILRRTKDEVATDLPEKSIVIQNVEIEGGQRDLYETVRLSMTKQVRDEISKKGFKSSQIIILDALLKLRQVCCDPRLVKLNAGKKNAESAKLVALLEILEELQNENRKVLVFSQFTSMLDIIASELKQRKVAFVELRGDTRDRETPVKEFQNSSVPVFLLSLKAGGTGLNLTAADVVIHYDPWWNPAAEDQATDRAHRIGQTKKVFVYKLVVKGSIEERMLQLQEKKRTLASAIYEGGASSGRALDEKDLELLLRPIDSLE